MFKFDECEYLLGFFVGETLSGHSVLAGDETVEVLGYGGPPEWLSYEVSGLDGEFVTLVVNTGAYEEISAIPRSLTIDNEDYTLYGSYKIHPEMQCPNNQHGEDPGEDPEVCPDCGNEFDGCYAYIYIGEGFREAVYVRES